MAIGSAGKAPANAVSHARRDLTEPQHAHRQHRPPDQNVWRGEPWDGGGPHEADANERGEAATDQCQREQHPGSGDECGEREPQQSAVESTGAVGIRSARALEEHGAQGGAEQAGNARPRSGWRLPPDQKEERRASQRRRLEQDLTTAAKQHDREGDIRLARHLAVAHRGHTDVANILDASGGRPPEPRPCVVAATAEIGADYFCLTRLTVRPLSGFSGRLLPL